jgi:tetratricopeptide (TPR) repeat protein
MNLSRYILLLGILIASLAFVSKENGETKKKKVRFLKDPVDKTLFDKAELLFEEKNYLLALPHYRKLEEEYPQEEVLRLRIGSCLTYNNEGVKALEYLSGLDQKKLRKTELVFFLARAYHLNNKFDEALAQLDQFMKQNPATPRKDDITRLIEYCNNGKIFVASPVEAKIENIGPPINTAGSEYVPVISSDESVMIYTYRGERSTGGLLNSSYEPDPEGEYSEDVFISYKQDGKWSEPQSLSSINGIEHDAAIALSNDGQKLFIYTNENGSEDIFLSVLNGSEWTRPEKLSGGVNSEEWEGSASLSADERTLFFASERAGGFGGRDIYKATLQPDGTWGNVQNLGPMINTPYDDDAPFIHPDGRMLHFSSMGHNSMGGYDVFRSMLNPMDSTWSVPKNLGYPINTAGDDRFYVVTADGKRGYYSSGKTGGFGEQDIYVVEPAMDGVTTLLIALKGTVMIDDQPVEASISVKYQGTDKTIANFKSNSLTGKYLVNLPVGYKYVVTYKANEFEEYKEIDATTINTFMETIEDKKFYTATYRRLKKMQDSLSTINTVDTTALSMNLPKGNQQLSHDDVIKLYGNITADGLIFCVQIGAYNKPQNFKYGQVTSLGSVDKKKLEDGITRFTMGTHNKLVDANALRKKIIDKGITDAFVIALYNDKRLMLEDLVKNGIFK